MTDNQKIIEIIYRISQKIKEKKEYLTELDQPIGDSDHGINLARGFAAVEEKLQSLAGNDIGTILKTVGMTLVSTVGGASGPLYGSAYMKAGMALPDKTEMDIRDFILLLETAVDAVKQRGKADAEAATMLDAMIPSVRAMKNAETAGKPAEEVLAAGVAAAWDGAKHTRELVATKGRASYVGERGIGHQDPGATSYCYMLETIAETI